MATINELRFPISEALLATYNTSGNTDLFDPENLHLVLHVQPGDYRPVWSGLGESGIIDGYGASVVQTTRWRYGFDVAIAEGRTAAYNVIRVLGEQAAAIPAKYEAIAVLDYVHPEAGDAVSQGYTVRLCRLESLQPSGTLRADDTPNSARYSQGFQFRMVEIKPRRQS